mmetsp:Transcript_43240/g.119565  ORF Transcript_43240/g.119565 Transcript_43240/m.119565 type:complete len:222 (-) Transcript_43240:620-1285(-)
MHLFRTQTETLRESLAPLAGMRLGADFEERWTAVGDGTKSTLTNVFLTLTWRENGAPSDNKPSELLSGKSANVGLVAWRHQGVPGCELLHASSSVTTGSKLPSSAAATAVPSRSPDTCAGDDAGLDGSQRDSTGRRRVGNVNFTPLDGSDPEADPKLGVPSAKLSCCSPSKLSSVWMNTGYGGSTRGFSWNGSSAYCTPPASVSSDSEARLKSAKPTPRPS